MSNIFTICSSSSQVLDWQLNPEPWKKDNYQFYNYAKDSMFEVELLSKVWQSSEIKHRSEVGKDNLLMPNKGPNFYSLRP
jgi:hypothetical protein